MTWPPSLVATSAGHDGMNPRTIAPGSGTPSPLEPSCAYAAALVADNLTDSDYQPFPGTPAAGRQVSLRVSYAW